MVLRRAPYENAYLGTFIFTLGVLSRVHNPEDESLVVPTLVQQTPHDQPLGDLLAEWGTRHVLLEFKRFEEDVQTEPYEKPSKWERVTTWAATHPEHSCPEALTHAHWVAWGDASVPDLIFLPYSTISDGPRQARDSAMSLDGFIRDMLDQANKMHTVGVAWKDLKEYLEWLSRGTGGTRQPDVICGFLVSVDAKGKIALAPYDRLIDIERTVGGRVRQKGQSPAVKTVKPTTARRGSRKHG
jgi:hypothetical protein